MPVNEKILQYLKEKGISQKKLADDLGVVPQNLFRMLKSDDLKVSTLIKISQVLEVPPAYFLDGKDTAYNEHVEELERAQIARMENYYSTVRKLFQDYFKDEPEEIKNNVLDDMTVSEDFFKDMSKTLSRYTYELTGFSVELIKKDIAERIKREKLKPRAKSINEAKKKRETKEAEKEAKKPLLQRLEEATTKSKPKKS